METKQELKTHYATADEIQQIKENLGDFFNVDDHGNLTLKPDLKIPVFKMIFVRGGEAKLGAKDREDNLPHDVKLTYNFFMAEYPVTQELYKAVTKGKTPIKFQGTNHPVEQVSWKGAMEFCNMLNDKIRFKPICNNAWQMLNPQGKPTEDITQLSGFRLPTESEWEYAASAASTSSATSSSATSSSATSGSATSGSATSGSATDPDAELVEAPGGGYSGGQHLDEVGWYDDNNDYETKPVGLKFPNELGIYDMSGNVWEWCLDGYDENFFKEDQKYTNPANLGKGSARVLRGGAWISYADDCRMAIRINGAPDDGWIIRGFRLLFAFQFTK